MIVDEDAGWFLRGDAWTLVTAQYPYQTNLYPEAVFCQANGYMGVRAYAEERACPSLQLREGYIAGLFFPIGRRPTSMPDTSPTRAEQLVALPDFFSCGIVLEGERFDPAIGTVSEYTQALDMRTALLTRAITWRSPAGRTTRMVFERFLSAADPHLACQRVTLTALDWSGSAEMTFQTSSAHETMLAYGDERVPQRQFAQFMTEHDGPVSSICARIIDTPYLLAIASAISPARHPAGVDEHGELCQRLRTVLERGNASAIERVIWIGSTRDGVEEAAFPGIAWQAAAEAVSSSFTHHLEASARVWRERWETADIRITGEAGDDKAVRFNTFHLLQCAPFDFATVSIPARGYSSTEYQGMYFWDTEIFMLPLFIYTQPRAARHLLGFRHHALAGARDNARRLGMAGAMYPFVSNADPGAEKYPGEMGNYLTHQTAAVAYGVDLYARVTGDLDFMRHQGMEILIETARAWASRVERDDAGAYHLDRMIGPDEVEGQPGRDNGYTNLMVRHSLAETVAWLRRLPEAMADVTEAEITRWCDIADRLVIPTVAGTAIPLQDQFFPHKLPLDVEASGLRGDPSAWRIDWWKDRARYQVIKQADIILAMYLLADRFTREELARAYAFYEPKTAHISSLSYNIHAIVACMIGQHDQAYDFFRRSAFIDLHDHRGSTTATGIHTASMGGTWQSVMMGFCGMRLTEDGLVFTPRLPPTWSGVQCRVRHGDTRLAVSIEREEQGYRVTVEPEPMASAAE